MGTSGEEERERETGEAHKGFVCFSAKTISIVLWSNTVLQICAVAKQSRVIEGDEVELNLAQSYAICDISTSDPFLLLLLLLCEPPLLWNLPFRLLLWLVLTCACAVCTLDASDLFAPLFPFHLHFHLHCSIPSTISLVCPLPASLVGSPRC
jgi:hypothetical protein